MIRTLITICLAALCITAEAQQKHNARTPDDPARAALAENDRPLVIDTVLTGSKIYPGTKRGIQVVVPKEYDGKTPKPLCSVDGLPCHQHEQQHQPLFAQALQTVGRIVGPGFGLIGPAFNFTALDHFPRLICSFLMIIGRLELYTIIVLFSRHYWNPDRG